MNEVKKEDIVVKDNNLEQSIYKILNDAYHEFRDKHGDKHSEHIKNLIESISDRVERQYHYEGNTLAQASHGIGIRYCILNDNLAGILKHELCHIYHRSKSEQHYPIPSLYIPSKYFEILNKLDITERKRGNGEEEKWVEWFNSQTYTNDTKDNFIDWEEGFFTRSKSVGTFYDRYINMVNMLSCIIPKEKLIEAFLNNSDYHTDYSFPEMIEDFDNEYVHALDKDEEERYVYPYLKMILNTEIISRNAIENPIVAREALQSSMKTLFNAYLIKLENMQNMDIEIARTLYSEIKYMQEQMIWNLDKSKMQNLDYIKALIKVQDKFKNMLQQLGLKTAEIEYMLETIDYSAENPFQKIEGGETISEKIFNNSKLHRDNLISIGDYKINVGKNGIKDNLYSSLFVLLGNKKFNLLFQADNSSKESENILLSIHKQIQGARTEEEFISIFNYIYELYMEKIDNELRTNQLSDYELSTYQKDIIELQSLGLFDEKRKRYIPVLEQLIDLYKVKAEEYKKYIDEAVEKRIKSASIEENRRKKLGYRYLEETDIRCQEENRANEFKKKLVAGLDEQRKKQALEYAKISEKKKSDEGDER